MARSPRPDRKAQALRQQGALHPHPERVRDPLFVQDEFFDPRDLVQLRYELVRRVRVDGQPVTAACTSFGVSRPVFYKTRQALEQAGLPGLVPKKRGPHGAHKLTAKVMAVIERALLEDRSAGAAALARLVAERLGVTVHPRSVQRALARREKKQRRAGELP